MSHSRCCLRPTIDSFANGWMFRTPPAHGGDPISMAMLANSPTRDAFRAKVMEHAAHRRAPRSGRIESFSRLNAFGQTAARHHVPMASNPIRRQVTAASSFRPSGTGEFIRCCAQEADGFEEDAARPSSITFFPASSRVLGGAALSERPRLLAEALRRSSVTFSQGSYGEGPAELFRKRMRFGFRLSPAIISDHEHGVVECIATLGGETLATYAGATSLPSSEYEIAGSACHIDPSPVMQPTTGCRVSSAGRGEASSRTHSSIFGVRAVPNGRGVGKRNDSRHHRSADHPAHETALQLKRSGYRRGKTCDPRAFLERYRLNLAAIRRTAARNRRRSRKLARQDLRSPYFEKRHCTEWHRVLRDLLGDHDPIRWLRWVVSPLSLPPSDMRITGWRSLPRRWRQSQVMQPRSSKPARVLRRADAPLVRKPALPLLAH